MYVYPALKYYSTVRYMTLSQVPRRRGGGQVEALRRPPGIQAEEVETSIA